MCSTADSAEWLARVMKSAPMECASLLVQAAAVFLHPVEPHLEE